MLAHPKLNAVWISTSTDVHASQTLAGIEKGLHVLCEKPLSTNMEEVRHGQTTAPLVSFQYVRLLRTSMILDYSAHAYKSYRPNESSTLPLIIPS